MRLPSLAADLAHALRDDTEPESGAIRTAANTVTRQGRELLAKVSDETGVTVRVDDDGK